MNRFHELWSVVEEGVSKLKASFAGEPPLTASDYMTVYSAVYQLCADDKGQCLRVYNKYRIVFEDYLSSTVLPSLQEKQGELLLRDFATRWSNHKKMTSTMFRFFSYLDRYFIPDTRYFNLTHVANLCFAHLVYSKIEEKICDAIVHMIDQEREGHGVDRALLKNAVNVFVEFGEGDMLYYKVHFEAPMLERTAAYYSRTASKWILQANECLKAEKDRVSHYLHPSTEKKLLKIVRQVLLAAHTAQLQLQDREEMQVVP